jgi:hypothetical protein
MGNLNFVSADIGNTKPNKILEYGKFYADRENEKGLATSETPCLY